MTEEYCSTCITGIHRSLRPAHQAVQWKNLGKDFTISCVSCFLTLGCIQQVDLGLSTFKKKEDTEAGRDKYVSVLAVLLAGSFIIPMVQYWWYIRDDDRPID